MTRVAASDDDSDGDDAKALVQAEQTAQSSPAEDEKGEGFKWPAADGRAFASVMIVSGVNATVLHGGVLVVVNYAPLRSTTTVAHTACRRARCPPLRYFIQRRLRRHRHEQQVAQHP